MATFYENLRFSNRLPTRGVMQKVRQQEWKAEKAYEEANQDWIDRQVKNTAPLREEIKQISDGKIMVDESIYNEKELQKIKGAVQKMKDYNNGILFPGYTIITNVDDDSSDVAGSTETEGSRRNLFGYQTFPSWKRMGTKNSPYKITITDANNVWSNDYRGDKDAESGWHPKAGEEGGTITQAHELAHSAHKNSLKKSHPPMLTMSPEENEAYEKLTSKYSSFKDLVEKITNELHLKNTKNAAYSVSNYAFKSHDEDSTDKEFPYAELFAEAYSDVLYNGESAKPYSKILVQAYSDYLTGYNNIFGDEKDRPRREFENIRNSFVNNLRNSKSPTFSNGRYIIR